MAKPRRAKQLHPLGGAPERNRKAEPCQPDRGHLRRQGAPALGRRRRGNRLRADALLHRVSQNRRVVRRLGRRLSARLPQPQCAGGARRVGHPAAEPAGRTSPLRAHQLDPRRRGQPAVAGDEEGRQRRLGAAGVSRGRREGLQQLAAPASAAELRGAAGRALDPRRRLQRQAALRAPAGRQARLQPEQAGPSLARLPHLLCGQPAAGAGGGNAAGQPDGIVVCAAAVVEVSRAGA